jgi:hypothetical protein
MDIPASFALAKGDDLYIRGTIEALNRFYAVY